MSSDRLKRGYRQNGRGVSAVLDQDSLARAYIVDVSVVDLDDQQERLLNLAINKVSGGWNDEALASLLADLQMSREDLALPGLKRMSSVT